MSLEETTIERCAKVADRHRTLAYESCEDLGSADPETGARECHAGLCTCYERDLAGEAIAAEIRALPPAPATPAARWRADGAADPHDSCYDVERAALVGGKMTDDEVANAVFLDPNINNLTAAKDRIRWLSRALTAAIAEAGAAGWRPIETAPKSGEVLLRVKRRAGVPDCMLVGHFMEGGFCIEDHPAIDRGWYFWNGCMFDKAAEPTHWRPLPATGAK